MISSVTKKILFVSFLVLVAFTGFVAVDAVSTNGAATPWTREKAEHLARKTLIGATPATVDQLFAAGSAANAVDILFPSTAPSTTQFDAEMASLMSEVGFDMTSRDWMNRYYQLKLYRNPYEAKQKLALLFYDIWAVNKNGDIDYADVIEQHDLIDSLVLGDYRRFTKRLVFNNDTGQGVGGRGDYAAGKFVDLFRQNIDRPNENYARELVQLFLMGEYRPFESAEDGDTPNYTDEDVANLAKWMTGLEDDLVTHQVTYNPLGHNTSTDVFLLSGPVAAGYTFPFYNAASGTVNFDTSTFPQGGNNGLFDNIIEYLFGKRETQIAEFLAYKLFTYYVEEDPSPAQITTLANYIVANNFVIEDAVKYLLTQDWMYSNDSMNTLYYKNPIDLLVGTLKVLTQNDSSTIHTKVYDHNYLSSLDWEPFYPGSVFGRDGFDRNADWLSEYSYNQWLTIASNLVYQDTYGGWVGGVAMTGSNGLLAGFTGTTATGLVDYLEDTVYIGQVLDTSVKSDIINYVTSGGALTFDLNDNNFVDTRVRGAVVLMLTQPEFLLVNGFDLPNVPVVPAASSIAGNHNIVFLELFGGMDWIYGVLPKDQYTDYVTKRSILAVPYANMLPMGEHFINDQLDDFKTLYDNGNLRLFHGIGLPNHSRGHDTAQRQSVSALNEQKFNAKGIFGQLIENDDSQNTVVIGSVKPNVMSHGQYMNIGRNSAEIRFGGNWASLPNSTERDALVDSLKAILGARTYPDQTEVVFDGALTLDTIASLSGQSAPGYQLSGQLAYIQKLMENNYGHAYYAIGGGGYDTHANQQDGNYLGNKLGTFTDDVKRFFDNFSVPGETLTIVVHTEFGRTIQRNGSDGTDHGQAGGIYMISNNPSVLSSFPEKTYGDVALFDEKRDRLGPGIDVRAVYGNLFDSMYLGNPNYANPYSAYDISVEVDTQEPEYAFFRPEFTPHSWNATAVTFRFEVEDVNFRPHTMASHIIPAVGDSPTTMNELSFWSIRNNVLKEDDGQYELKDSSNAADTEIYFDIDLMDNQHTFENHSGSALMPTIYDASITTVPTNKHAILRAFSPVTVNGATSLGATGIQLPAGTYQAANTTHIALNVTTGTSITSLDGSGVWNGAFLLPWQLDIEPFLSQTSREIPSNDLLDLMTVEELFVVGPDTLGVGADINDPVELQVGGLTPSQAYKVLHSIDGKDWTVLATGVLANAGGTASFNTNSFSYFAMVSDEVSCELRYEKLPGAYEYELVWEAPNATSLTIDQGIGSVTGLTGTYAITMPEDIVRTYTMTASDGSTNVQCSTTIDTQLNIVFTAPTCTLDGVDNGDGTVTLTWTTSGALAGIINNNVGDLPTVASGSNIVNVNQGQTITYVLDVLGVNLNGSCSEVVSIAASSSGGGSSGGGSSGGGSSSLRPDSCPDINGDGIENHLDDRSGSRYDRKCLPDGVNSNDFQLNDNGGSAPSGGENDIDVEAGSSTPITTTNSVSDQDIVKWAYDHNLTMFDSVATFGGDQPILREHASKFVIEYMRNVLDVDVDRLKRNTPCPFQDLYKANKGLQSWVCDSYRLSIFNGDSDYNFLPKMSMWKSHSWTIAIKILYGELGTSNPWYKSYYDRANNLGVLPSSFSYSQAEQDATRMEVVRMLYNIAQWHEQQSDFKVYIENNS